MSAYDYKVLSSNGDLVDLSHYKGHVTLFVNVSCFDDKAKKCYELLATVYQKYKDEDLAVLLFPCSQFGSKETSPEKEIEFLRSSNLSEAGIIFKELEVFRELNFWIFQVCHHFLINRWTAQTLTHYTSFWKMRNPAPLEDSSNATSACS